MKTYRSRLILFLIQFFLSVSGVLAQEKSQEFALPVAHVGEGYRAEIESVLREKYQLRLESGNANGVILWTMVSGEVPSGLSVRTDGTVIGRPNEVRAGIYQFSLKAVDMAVRDEPLELHFSLEVRAGRLRLTKIEGPRLVPIDTAPPVNAAFNHPASPVIGSKETSAKNEDTSTNSEPVAKTEAGAAPEPQPPAIRQMKNADPKDFTNPFSSMNKRFILGVEQSGGASAKSQGKPFLNLFINTPLFRSSDDELARVSVWGDVRLTSTPSQITAFANISSAAIDTITGGNVNELALGFDFVVGPEVRISRFDNVTLNFISAFGAVSPLSPEQSVQLFEVPKANSSQAEAFFKEFPDAKGKDHIAFIAPERDRFLRQYFGGLRFKTYTKDGTPSKIQNVFPSMLDVTFGQNEAVTGGRLHKFVFGLDGFYVLPFPDKYRLLYLFGSAKFKVGGPKSIKTPFLLDTSASSVKVTDPSVFIAEPRPSNRDVYRIGFGVDLFELFRKN